MVGRNSGRFPGWMVERCGNGLKAMFGEDGRVGRVRGD